MKRQSSFKNNTSPSPFLERGKEFLERGEAPLLFYSPFPLEGKGVRGMGY
jgi:hypothetical protein